MTFRALAVQDAVCLSEQDVQSVMPPDDVCASVRHLITAGDLRPGFAVEQHEGNLSLGAKSGFVGEQNFGLKVRAGQEGTYVTLVWRDGGTLSGVVESAYLTYLRTAALLMLPPLLHEVPVFRILVMGTGRLGSACCVVAHSLYRGAELLVWSPSRTAPRMPWPDLDYGDFGFWAPADDRRGFDLVVTATRSKRPLPLDGVAARYVSVGGAVKPDRRELPASLVVGASQLCADAPGLASAQCGDLRGLKTGVIRSYGSASAADGTTITFVCGTGAIDVGLALEACDRARGR